MEETTVIVTATLCDRTGCLASITASRYSHFPFYRSGNRSLEGKSDLSKITQLANRGFKFSLSDSKDLGQRAMLSARGWEALAGTETRVPGTALGV